MKLKKISSCLLSAVVFSCSAFTCFSVNAAENTVRISASNETAASGSQFAVDVSLADIPVNGIQVAEFAVKYDSSLVSVDSIEKGPLINSNLNDVDSSSKFLPAFGSSISNEKGIVTVSIAILTDSLGYDDPSYNMNGEGVMFTINGTVLDSAPAGSVADFEIIPIPRKVNDSDSAADNNKIWLGYDSVPDINETDFVIYNSVVSNGSVTVSGDVLMGDVNNDGVVTIADAVAIAAFVGNPENNPLSEKSKINGDVHDHGNGIDANDALMIQQYIAQIVSNL